MFCQLYLLIIVYWYNLLILDTLQCTKKTKLCKKRVGKNQKTHFLNTSQDEIICPTKWKWAYLAYKQTLINRWGAYNSKGSYSHSPLFCSAKSLPKTTGQNDANFLVPCRSYLRGHWGRRRRRRGVKRRRRTAQKGGILFRLLQRSFFFVKTTRTTKESS